MYIDFGGFPFDQSVLKRNARVLRTGSCQALLVDQIRSVFSLRSANAREFRELWREK